MPLLCLHNFFWNRMGDFDLVGFLAFQQKFSKLEFSSFLLSMVGNWDISSISYGWVAMVTEISGVWSHFYQQLFETIMLMVEYLRGLVQTSLLFSIPLLTVLIGFTFSPAKQSIKTGYSGNVLYFLFWSFSPDTVSCTYGFVIHT